MLFIAATNASGAGTIFHHGGHDKPFPAGGLRALKGPRGVRAEPRRQADFDNNLLKIIRKSGLWVNGRIGSADRSCDKSC